MSEIRWTREWHDRAKEEVSNGAHLDRDESELALAEIERAWGEIERLTKERGELLAEATAATNQISDMHAEIERLKSTKSAALEKYMAEARDLRVTVCWAVDRNDLASAPIETVLSLLRRREAVAPPEKRDTVATAIEAGTKVLMGAPFGMRRAYAQDVVSTIVVATLDTVVDAVPGLLTAEGRATPAPLTEAEARAWADLHDQTQAGCLTREEAHAADVALILSVSRGDIPDAVRAEKGGGAK